MIKVVKNKNPDLKGKEFIDEHFFNMLRKLLMDAIMLKYQQQSKIFNVTRKDITKVVDELSTILIYKNIGFKKCTDCKKYFENCKCDYLDPDDFKKLDKLIEKIQNLILKYASEEDMEKIIWYLEDYRKAYRKRQNDGEPLNNQLVDSINKSINKLSNKK